MEKQEQYLAPLVRKMLLKAVQTEVRPEYRRRLEIMLRADMGESQTQICTELGCSQDTARYWIAMAQSGQAHNWNDHPIGRPKTINKEYLLRLKELVSNSPREYGYSFGRWTAQCLRKHLTKELGIEVSDRHINRLLKEMGLSTRNRDQEASQTTNVLRTKSFGITISDLEPSKVPDFFWPFNLNTLSS